MYYVTFQKYFFFEISLKIFKHIFESACVDFYIKTIKGLVYYSISPQTRAQRLIQLPQLAASQSFKALSLNTSLKSSHFVQGHTNSNFDWIFFLCFYEILCTRWPCNTSASMEFLWGPRSNPKTVIRKKPYI